MGSSCDMEERHERFGKTYLKINCVSEHLQDGLMMMSSSADPLSSSSGELSTPCERLSLPRLSPSLSVLPAKVSYLTTHTHTHTYGCLTILVRTYH